MMNRIKVFVIAACFSVVTSAAIAQDIVHALSGTVQSVNPKIKMTEITTDNGSSGHFEWLKKTGPEINFDKNVRADAVDADKFTNKGAHVIVFFVGDGQVRTIIAVRDLGAGPLEKTSGTVVKLSRHERLLTIKNSAGVEESFRLDPKTVADTSNGVAEDFKFDYAKGDTVLVTAAPSNGGETALLIAPVM
ncbi:MAG: hypothetical protein ABSG84_17945 [Acidobacteriaceae bacterium]|jgi:hypothetical protein